MKHSIFIFTLLFALCVSVQAQRRASSREINERMPHVPQNREHVVITVPTKMLPGKTLVVFDFGRDARKASETKMYDHQGNKVQFNTLADVMNYMSNDNWELDHYTLSSLGMSPVHFIIMSRPVKEVTN